MNIASRIALLLSSATLAFGQIAWDLQNGFAAANLATQINNQPVLFADGVSGSRFEYTIIGTAPLVTVSLFNAETGKSYTVQTNFAPAAQTCSCYWLDADELLQRFPDLTSSLKYAIRFRSDDGKFDMQSGWLGIVTNGLVTWGMEQPPQGISSVPGSIVRPGGSTAPSSSTPAPSSSPAAAPSVPPAAVSTTNVTRSQPVAPFVPVYLFTNATTGTNGTMPKQSSANGLMATSPLVLVVSLVQMLF